jgi:diguanylate cyclase (GGDEF)-like protein/PAS domain S-box-containing protein
LSPLLLLSEAAVPAVPLRTLHTVSEVFRLSKSETIKGYPVELDAIVTYSDPEWGTLFLYDRTGPTFIDVHGAHERYLPGTHIRVSAVTGTDAGGGPAVTHARITVLGRVALPRPQQRTIAEIDTGVAESYRVVTEGIVHQCDEPSPRVCFQVFDGDKKIWLTVPEPESSAADSLIGATVRITGVMGRRTDEITHRVSGRIFVNSLSDIQVETSAPAISFTTPPSSLQDLHASDADQRWVRPVHLRGPVIWQSPGLFILQDRTGTTFVGCWKTVLVRSGTVVDVIGFPSHGEFGLEVADSAVQLSPDQSGAAVVAPLEMNAADIVKQSLSGKRVHLKARLIAQSATATEFVYQLDDNGQRFNAVLLRNETTHETVGLTHQSILELTGIALVQNNGTRGWPESLLLLVESPKDIVVVGGTGWLTPKRTIAIIGAVFLCVIAPLVWVKQLRSTVRKQTAIIRARLENEMQLETKFRRLFERNLAGVYTWQPDGPIVECNQAFARLLGFQSPQQVVGRSYWDLVIDDNQRNHLKAALEDEALSNLDTSLRRDDGAIVHLLTNITPVEGPAGIVYETTAIDVTQLRQNQEDLQKAKDAAVHESLNDSLTGLPNRRYVLDKLSAMLVMAERDAEMLGLLYLDLDGFKLVNDSLGHAVGDALLVQVAACLRSRIREGDMLARLGGDEFLLIMDHLHDRADATMLAEHLLEAISNPFLVSGHLLSIGVSIGVSIYPTDATDAEELMQQADSAMYAAKREGKNRVTHYTAEIGFQMHERLTLENLLRGAVARNEIFVHYQPEFELSNHRLLRFEALARWRHPTLGQIPPDKFIPIAEESGMIGALGAYIMEKACAEAVRWQAMMPHSIQLAVNVSSIQFRSKGFADEVCAILERTGLKPELLQLELTESVMMNGNLQAAETMTRLRALGITMAIDDFGTGYSNLSYLPTLSFDALKIDRSFMLNLDSQPETESMISTLISLAHNFGMRVIVEGVETAEQLELIKALGANEVQGYLVGRPTANPEALMMHATAS